MEKQSPKYSVALYDYGMTPASSEITAEPTSSGYDVYVWFEDYIDPPRKIISHTKDFTWKDFAHTLMNLEEGFIGDDAIDQVVVSGIDGLRAECLKYAWASECDGVYPIDYKELLNWVLTLEEQTIDYLESNYDLSTEGKDLAIVIELKEYVLNGEIKDFLMLLQAHKLDDDINAIQKMIDIGKIESNAKVIKKKEENQARLEPFAKEIEKIVTRISDNRSRSPYSPPSNRKVFNHLSIFIVTGYFLFVGFYTFIYSLYYKK